MNIGGFGVMSIMCGKYSLSTNCDWSYRLLKGFFCLFFCVLFCFSEAIFLFYLPKASLF